MSKKPARAFSTEGRAARLALLDTPLREKSFSAGSCPSEKRIGLYFVPVGAKLCEAFLIYSITMVMPLLWRSRSESRRRASHSQKASRVASSKMEKLSPGMKSRIKPLYFCSSR